MFPPARSRNRRPIVATLGVAAALALAAALSACASGPDTPSESIGASLNTKVPAALASIPLHTANGTTTSIAALRGHTVVVADFLTLCQEICPLTTSNLAAAAEQAARTKQKHPVTIVEVTVDPERDTPQRLAAYRKLVGDHPGLVYATGSAADLAKLWKYFGVFFERTPEQSPPATDWWTGQPLTYDVAHADDLVFIDSHGNERFVIDGDPDTQGKVPPAKLAAFLSAEGHDNMAHPQPGSWTTADVLQVLHWLNS